MEVDGRSQGLPSDLEVIETPGHTPGHVCHLLDRDHGILLVGDAAVSTKDGRVAKGWVNRRGQDWDTSIVHIAEREFSQAWFGHAGPIGSGASEAFRAFAASL